MSFLTKPAETETSICCTKIIFDLINSKIDEVRSMLPHGQLYIRCSKVINEKLFPKDGRKLILGKKRFTEIGNFFLCFKSI